jgi:mannose/fructose-specific phosphotransferase system component IIA
MSVNYGIIVVAHSRLAEELVHTAFAVLGEQPNVAGIALTSEQNLEAVCARIAAARDAMQVDGYLVLTDMMGGTPCNASMMLCKDRTDIHIISGVNLYMLITAITARASADSPEEYLQKVLAAGRGSILDVKDRFRSRLGGGS